MPSVPMGYRRGYLIEAPLEEMEPKLPLVQTSINLSHEKSQGNYRPEFNASLRSMSWNCPKQRKPPTSRMRLWPSCCTACALRGHCMHTAHAEAGILTQEYLSPDLLYSEAAKPT